MRGFRDCKFDTSGAEKSFRHPEGKELVAEKSNYPWVSY